MKLSVKNISHTIVLITCVPMLCTTYTQSAPTCACAMKQPTMINHDLGLRFSLLDHLKTPLYPNIKAQRLVAMLLDGPANLLATNNALRSHVRDDLYAKNESLDPERVGEMLENHEDLRAVPFMRFNTCLCIPFNPAYTIALQTFADKAVTAYQRKNPREPFVYTSFASGGLFPDLYLLTLFVQKLRTQGIQAINIRVNLIDTDLRDYIAPFGDATSNRNVAVSRSRGNQTVHAHALYFNANPHLALRRKAPTTDLLTDFLQWFTQNLRVNFEVYIYGNGYDYMYDHDNGRAPSSDMLVAYDYFDEAEGDLAQLALRTVKVDGYFCSLNKRKYSHGKEPIAYAAASKKIAEVPSHEFQQLITEARGDNRLIGALLYPLVYPSQNVAMPRSSYSFKRALKRFRFNPLNYFEIEYMVDFKN